MAVRFDLNTRVATWRSTLQQRGTIDEAALDELESHLWDTIDGLIEEGASEREAFVQACFRLGHEDALAEEYHKVLYWSAPDRSWRHHVVWPITMFNNYLKIALRSLRKQKGYAFINVFGLALGMAGCLLILSFVLYEVSFDDLHEKGDRIYRVNKTLAGDQATDVAEVAGLLGPTMVQEIPEVSKTTRLRPWFVDVLVSHQDRNFYVDDYLFADSTFFEIFDFALVRGDAASVLDAPLSVVITEEMAALFFDGVDPIGQPLKGLFDMPLTVTGIVEDAPANSHIQFDMLVSWSTAQAPAYAQSLGWFDAWPNLVAYTYVLLEENATPSSVEVAFPQLIETHAADWQGKRQPYLQALADIHLHSAHVRSDVNAKAGNSTFVYVLATIGLLILVIAIINFTNLSTARATRRAREVGMRKALGAFRKQLVWQFLGESFLMSLIAIVLALLFVQAFEPLFGMFLDRPLSFNVWENNLLLAGIVGITVLVGLAAGTYPALILSRFQPVLVLKGSFQGGIRQSMLRKALVVTQFVASIALLAGAGVVYQQMHYTQTKDLGFDDEQVVMMYINGTQIAGQYDSFEQTLLRHPNITGVTVSDLGPGKGSMGFPMRPVGAPDEEPTIVQTVAIAPDYVETMGMSIVEGRDFSEDLATDARSVLINEQLAQQLGKDSPIGQQILLGGEQAQTLNVIGVVQDFHIASLHRSIEPLLLYPTNQRYWNVYARVRAENVAETLAFLEETWQSFEAVYPYAYTFLDEEFAQRYEAEVRLMQMLGTFAGLAIVIACLGLFGLAAFLAEQRTKEIGIRKTLGASSFSILGLLSKDFTRLVLVAFVVAVPIAYFAMNQWLQAFPYRIDIGPGVFLLAGMAGISIAFLTVSYQSIRAALAAPIKALRHE